MARVKLITSNNANTRDFTFIYEPKLDNNSNYILTPFENTTQNYIFTTVTQPNELIIVKIEFYTSNYANWQKNHIANCKNNREPELTNRFPPPARRSSCIATDTYYTPFCLLKPSYPPEVYGRISGNNHRHGQHIEYSTSTTLTKMRI